MLAVKKKQVTKNLLGKMLPTEIRIINAVTEISGEISFPLYTGGYESGKTWSAWSRGKADGWGQPGSDKGIHTRVISSAKD